MKKTLSPRLGLSALIALGFIVLQSNTMVWADDFPGKGDRFAWSNALPYYNRGNKYLEHGRIEEAVQDFEEAIYRYEYDPDFYINYGVALRKRENYTGAEQAFKKALELRSNDWQACANLANAYLKQNRLKDTIACFQKAMKMQPPPPPQERDAMLKDIADITKILSMQKRNEVPTPSISTAKAKQSNGTSSKKQLAQTQKRTSKAEETPAPAAPVEKTDLKQSGWDYVK